MAQTGACRLIASGTQDRAAIAAPVAGALHIASNPPLPRMIAFYPQIKLVHVVCVLLSGTLFLLRGTGVLAGARWPMRLPVRLASYAIDTALLTAALMLFTLLPAGMFANGWLTAKLCLLVAYVVLGSFALRRGRTRGVRAGSFVAAVAVFVFMLSIARLHHPLGVFALFAG